MFKILVITLEYASYYYKQLLYALIVTVAEIRRYNTSWAIHIVIYNSWTYGHYATGRGYCVLTVMHDLPNMNGTFEDYRLHTNFLYIFVYILKQYNCYILKYFNLFIKYA